MFNCYNVYMVNNNNMDTNIFGIRKHGNLKKQQALKERLNKVFIIFLLSFSSCEPVHYCTLTILFFTVMIMEHYTNYPLVFPGSGKKKVPSP